MNWKEFKAEAEALGVNDDTEVTLADPNFGGVMEMVEPHMMRYSEEQHISRPGHPGLVTDVLMIDIPCVEPVD